MHRQIKTATSGLTRRYLLTSAAAVGATLIVRSSTCAQSSATPNTGDFAGLVDIGGRSLYLESRGSDGPTVILESGAGNDARVWDTVSLMSGTDGEAVLPEVAAFTRVVAYDRPGTFLGPGLPGRSDTVPNPRTAGEIVNDLHALLTAADIQGPYVMVGHSFGALVVRLYASTYPDDIAGLVLVDAAHEDYYEAVQKVMSPAQWDSFARPDPSTDYPNLERIDTIASANEMREAATTSPLRPMPMIVLTHGQPWEWPADFPAAALEALWLPLQEDLVSMAPDAKLIVAEQSGHFIQLQQPGLVLKAIRSVVIAVRDAHSDPSEGRPKE